MKWTLPDDRVPAWLVERLGVPMNRVRPLRLEQTGNGR
jgi:hypothetical protein